MTQSIFYVILIKRERQEMENKNKKIIIIVIVIVLLLVLIGASYFIYQKVNKDDDAQKKI